MNFIEEQINKGRNAVDSSLRIALTASEGMSAQQEANSAALSQELNLPQKVVQAAPEKAQEEQTARRISENAMFAQWASKSMSNATFAKEDTEGLKGLFDTVADASEKLTREVVPNIGRQLVHGAADVNRAMLGSAQAVSDNIFGVDSAVSLGLKGLQDWVKWARPNEVKAESFLGQLGYDFMRSAPQQAANIGAAIASPQTALSLMAAQITGGTYSELRDEGVSPTRALMSGLSNAAMQTPLEKLGLDKFLGIFKSKSFRDTLIRTGGAALTEGVTEFVQKYPEVASTLWGLAETKFKDPSDQIAWFGRTLFDADTLAQATQEGAYEGLIGAMWGGLGGSVQLLASRGQRQRTQDFADFMRTTHEAVEATKTKGLAPDVIENALESASQIFAQSVYVPADALLSEFENGNDLLTPLGISQGDIAQAIKDGTDIAIPHSRIQARLDMDGINTIANMVRENPDSPNMLETLVELDNDYDQTELEAAVEDAHLARQRNDAVKLQERRLIKELTPITGRDAAHTYATLMSSQARTFEKVYGVDAAELLKRRTIRKGEEGQLAEGATFNQGPAESVELHIEADEHLDPHYVQEINSVTDKEKKSYLVQRMQEEGYSDKALPILVVRSGDQDIAITGSHRLAAAREAEVEIPAVVLEYNEEYAEDFNELLEANDDYDRLDAAQKLYDEKAISKNAFSIIQHEVKANETPFVYYQTTKGEKRASVSLTPEQAAITIFKGADLSTIAHESAHIFLDDLVNVASDSGESLRRRLAESLARKNDPKLAGTFYAQLAEAGIDFDGNVDGITLEQAKEMLSMSKSFAEKHHTKETPKQIALAEEELKAAKEEYQKAYNQAYSKIAARDWKNAHALTAELPEIKALATRVQDTESLIESLKVQKETERKEASFVRNYGKSFEEFIRHMEGVEQAKRDFNTLMDFAGVVPDGYKGLDAEQYEHFHETVAKAFEQYLSEGKAPAPHLNGVFSRMFRWLKNLYKSWRDYVGADLNDDVRRVFDRMLATEQERQSDGMMETLSSTEEEFMNSLNLTEEEREACNNLLEVASSEARKQIDAKKEKEFNKLYKQAVNEVYHDVLDYNPWVYCYRWDDKRKKPVVYHPINRKELEDTIGVKEAKEFKKQFPGLVSNDSATFEGGDFYGLGEGYEQGTRESYEIIAEIVDALSVGRTPQGDIDMAAMKYVQKILQGKDDYGVPASAAEVRIVKNIDKNGGELYPDVSYAAQDEYGEYLEKMENVLRKQDYEKGELVYRRKQEEKKNKEINNLSKRIEKLQKQLADAQAAETTAKTNIKDVKSDTKDKKAEIKKLSNELARAQKQLEKVQAEPVRVEKKDIQAMERNAIGYKELRKIARKELSTIAIGDITYGKYQAAVRRALTARNKAVRRGDLKEAVNASQMARYSFALLQEARNIKKAAEKIERFGKKANGLKAGTLPGIQAEAVRKICYALGWTVSDTPRDGRAETSSLRDLVQQASDDAGMLDVMPMFAEWALNLQNPNLALQAQGKPLEWKQLTIEEATEIDNLLKFLVHSGREQNKENKESLAAKVASLAGRASEQMAGLSTHYAHKRDSLWESISRGWSSIQSLDWLIRKADGFKRVIGKKDAETGILENELYQPLRDAENKYQERLRKTQEAVTPHMMHLLKSAIQWGKEYGKHTLYIKDEQGNRIDFPDAMKAQGEKGWTADMVLAMALNLGNAGNRERLLYSYRDENGEGGISYNAMSLLLGDDAASLVYNMTDEARANLLATRPKREGILSAEDWKAVQAVWDVLGSQWEDTQLAHAKLYGFAPRGVDAESFTVTVGGQAVRMDGGYYPIKYDRSDVKTRERAEEQDILERAESIAPVPAAKKGHTMARTNHTGKPLALTVEPLQRHLVDSARFIELGQIVRFADKVTRDPNFAREFQRAFGINDYDRIRPNLKALVVDDSAPTGEMYKLAEKTRQHLTFFALAGNFKVALIQSTALFPAMGDIGFGNVAKGLVQLSKARMDAVHAVWEASPYMKRRFGNIDQDMARKAMDFRPDRKIRIVKGDKVYTWDDIVNVGMAPIAVMDTVASTAIWLGAYNKKLAELRGETVKMGVYTDDKYHRDAVAYADNIINLSNPDNDKLSSNAFSRDKSYQRLFNMFTSATVKFAQRTQYMYQGMKAGRISKADFARMEAYDILMPSVSMILMLGLMQGLFSGDDKDREKLADLAVSTTLGQLAMLVPVFGNVAADTITSLVMGGDVNRRAGLTIPLNTPFELAGKVKTALFAKQDKGEKLVWSTLDIASFLSRIPAGPVLRRAVKGFNQWMDDEGTPFSIIAPRAGK